jgi:hypothetical protein
MEAVMERKMITLSKKTGKEMFSIGDSGTNYSLLDYWSWAHSDLVNNTERGKVAEFIVASALGITEKPSTVWDSFDLLYKETV